MDFAKSFDKVPHRRLFQKLEYYGIRGSTHKWINSWLSGRTQQVILVGQASDLVPVLSSVPQGSVLGPVLFLIFINYLLDNIRSSVRLFADNCVLYGARTFRPQTFRPRTFRPGHFGHGRFGHRLFSHGKCLRWTFRP